MMSDLSLEDLDKRVRLLERRVEDSGWFYRSTREGFRDAVNELYGWLLLECKHCRHEEGADAYRKTADHMGMLWRWLPE